MENCYKRKVMNLRERVFSHIDFSLFLHQVGILTSSFSIDLDTLKRKTCEKKVADTCFFAFSFRREGVTTKSPHLKLLWEACKYFAYVDNKNVEEVTYCKLLPFNLNMSPPGVYFTVASGELGSTLHMNFSAFSWNLGKAFRPLTWASCKNWIHLHILLVAYCWSLFVWIEYIETRIQMSSTER